MKRMILSAMMIVAALTISIEAGAQTEKKQVNEKKTELLKTRKAAKKVDAKKVDAVTSATAKRV